jgi:nitrite reductase/ring-hydroxylating ferredoxin subunit/uncharacterized membrane protein
VSLPETLARQLTPLEPLIRRVESAEGLDAPAKAVGSFIRNKVAKGKNKELLSGTWLGHAVHPMLTDVVIGSFISASVLDVLAGRDGGKASKRLIALGIAAYTPTALTGLNDWADSEAVDDRIRRAGAIHALTNATAAWLYVASLFARRRGARGAGVVFSTAGASVLMAGGYLGGHLTLSRGVGADQTVFDPGPTDWTPAADASQLRDGQPTRSIVDDTPVLLLKDGELIFAIHDRCSHRGCSLSEGTLDGEEIVCACHSSRFDRRDGSVKRGPATAPQPAFQVRVRDGVVEVRRLGAIPA